MRTEALHEPHAPLASALGIDALRNREANCLRQRAPSASVLGIAPHREDLRRALLYPAGLRPPRAAFANSVMKTVRSEPSPSRSWRPTGRCPAFGWQRR